MVGESLGSISQPAARSGSVTACPHCRCPSPTVLRMGLGDGTPVTFVACPECEWRGWYSTDGEQLDRESVLSRMGRR